MKNFVLFSAVFVLFSGPWGGELSAQQQTGRKDMSVEESYLQETVNMAIVREAVTNPGMKLFVIDKIRDAVKSGNKSDELCESVKYLAMSGVVNQIREAGRVVNDYPDVRMEAARLLGEIGTPRAKEILTQMVLVDPEPMVLFEAVQALTKIGIDDADDAVTVIAMTFSRFDVLSPDNRLAMAVLDAYDKMYGKSGKLVDSALPVLQKIMSGSYIKPVQEYARQVINYFRMSTGS